MTAQQLRCLIQYLVYLPPGVPGCRVVLRAVLPLAPRRPTNICNMRDRPHGGGHAVLEGRASAATQRLVQFGLA